MTPIRVWLARSRTTFLLLPASVILLTLAFAPVNQFYLAWIGLAPWLIFLAGAKSKKSVFFWSWLWGTIFFTANMWWMAYISGPGMAALMIYLGLYWAVAGLVIYGMGLLNGGRVPILAGVFGVAAVWVGFEWLRGIIITGLPWLYLGHTQTPVLALCQIADITGAYGVSFWVATVNALFAMAWLQRRKPRQIAPAATVLVLFTLWIVVYGIYRIGQTPDSLSPGPTIAVVQPNYPQSNSGEHSETYDEALTRHEDQTLAALDRGHVDLVVWSETIMPPLNREMLAMVDAEMADDRYQRLPQKIQDEIRMPRIVYDAIQKLTSTHHLALLTGAEYVGGWKETPRDGGMEWVATDRRNSAYFFDRDGHMDDAVGKRYDKIHLVPWGEFIPFQYSIPWLYRLSIMLGPASYKDSVLQPGAPDALTVFQLQGQNRAWRFVTPICFEDIDALIRSAMFRPESGGGKRADFLVNITNDGWFKANENAQHLQAAVFRSIENRVWSARSVNTGISGFIDSMGKTSDLLPVRQEGTSARQIMIDSRLTFYTRFGDLFAWLCVAILAGIAIMGWMKRPRHPMKGKTSKE